MYEIARLAIQRTASGLAFVEDVAHCLVAVLRPALCPAMARRMPAQRQRRAVDLGAVLLVPLDVDRVLEGGAGLRTSLASVVRRDGETASREGRLRGEFARSISLLTNCRYKRLRVVIMHVIAGVQRSGWL